MRKPIFLMLLIAFSPCWGFQNDNKPCVPSTKKEDSPCRFMLNGTPEQPCKLYYQEKETKVVIDFTEANIKELVNQTASPKGDKCFSWRAILFSTKSPYVELLATDDLNGITHSFSVDQDAGGKSTDERCTDITALTFTFPEKVKWIRLFADNRGEYLPPLPDTASIKSGSSNKIKDLVNKMNSIVGAPGATAIQASWSPSFNGPQKFGVYSNLQYITNLGGKNEWFGISSFVDSDNRGQQNPDSAVNTLTYLRFLTPKDIADGKECSMWYGWKVRPLTLIVKSGAEYALVSDVLNQISTVSLQATIVVRSFANQESPITITPIVGIETGANFETRAVSSSADTIFRWVTGADASYRFHIPKSSWLLGSKPFTLSGTFKNRFVTTNEVFTTVNGSAVTERPDRRDRVYARGELSIPLSKIFSAGVIYQYGDLPPAFRFFGHTLSLSVKASSPSDYER